MAKLTSSPLVTKLIYISQEKSKTQEKDKYADYIQRGYRKTLLKNVSSLNNDENPKSDIIADVNFSLERFHIIKSRDTEEVFLDSSAKFDSNFIKEILKVVNRDSNSLNKVKDYDELVAKSIKKYCIKNHSDYPSAIRFYNEYIARRLGSTGLFSDLGEDVNQLLKEMKEHQGTIYLPIISLKEKDANLVGLKTETDWKIKAREYIKEFAHSINLSESDIKWVCAYHEKYYEKGELPDLDDDLLAHTDEHILALRRFLGEHSKNQEEIKRVKSIPKGKWNYLPSKSRNQNSSLALVKVNGKTLNSHHDFEDLFFVEVVKKNEQHIASYLDYPKALDRIKADPSENSKIEDLIEFDRTKVKSRAIAEAKRQASNPETKYILTPQYINALGILIPYFSSDIDFKGIIETGVSSIDVQKKLENVLRKVRAEQKDNGTIYASTLKEFENIFNVISENTAEEKEVGSVEISLYYAGS